MVGADLRGCAKQGRRKAEAFQGVATSKPVQISPIRRTIDMASICHVKAFDRGGYPAPQAFPCISRHLERHSSQINRSWP
jgi:hypothetical protein